MHLRANDFGEKMKMVEHNDEQGYDRHVSAIGYV